MRRSSSRRTAAERSRAAGIRRARRRRAVSIGGTGLLVGGLLIASVYADPIDGPTERAIEGSACVACASDRATVPAGSIPDATPEPWAEAAQDTPRAFRHTAHRSISCAGCHATGERHGTPMEWTPVDCASCHHDPGITAACSDCHASARYASPRSVQRTLTLSVWDTAATRRLPFDHEIHSDVSCRDCHREPVSLAPEECGACHERHHGGEADCAQCHATPDPAVHELDVHAGCAGSGCHSSAGLEEPPRSRAFCLVCHEPQRDHRIGEVCVRCHVIR
ncbi:MAG: cytochrome c3 family protein [Gemmatimonadota bacterium]